MKKQDIHAVAEERVEFDEFDAEDFDPLESDETALELEQLLVRVEAARCCGA